MVFKCAEVEGVLSVACVVDFAIRVVGGTAGVFFVVVFDDLDVFVAFRRLIASVITGCAIRLFKALYTCFVCRADGLVRAMVTGRRTFLKLAKGVTNVR
jgi:hypothetical protein